ncbi:sialic acid-binding Ig-like lectin 13 [Astyanax mexicanus]|uniref:Sialic acid-binding Ig-like lectin 13 n=1 Tax=Astyanax mexicanus TaxID=7994 RepID=A0A8T2KJM8_ASTMX|nr:sialic acid-binding Ig-like lectin 13 [Astyanax mexicanus]
MMMKLMRMMMMFCSGISSLPSGSARFCCGSVLMFLWVWGVCGSDWSVNVPTSIAGVSGLCVHVPCSFSYSGPRAPASKIRGLWFRGGALVCNSRQWEQVDALYVNRSRIVGSLERNECSLKIGLLGTGDAGSYMFRVEIDGQDRYSFKDQSVTLSVTDTPPAPSLQCPGVLAEGVPVSLVCSVVHTCREAAPVLRWTSVRAGQVVPQPQGRRQLQQRWEERAVLNLLPSPGTHGELLQCTAVFPNGLQRFTPPCRLQVNYAPQNVTVSVLSPLGLVSEEMTVVLFCQADSQPAPHRFSWFQGPEGREQLAVDQREPKLSVEKIPRNSGPYWCQVENSMGTRLSQPITVDVHYEPEITDESWCSVTFEQEADLSCECVAYGNPLPSIHWSVLHLEEKITGNTDPSWSEGHRSVGNLNISVLWNHTSTELVLQCVAENSLASTIKTFTLTRNVTGGTEAWTRSSSVWGVWGSVVGLGLVVLLVFSGCLIRSHRTARSSTIIAHGCLSRLRCVLSRQLLLLSPLTAPWSGLAAPARPQRVPRNFSGLQRLLLLIAAAPRATAPAPLHQLSGPPPVIAGLPCLSLSCCLCPFGGSPFWAISGLQSALWFHGVLSPGPATPAICFPVPVSNQRSTARTVLPVGDLLPYSLTGRYSSVATPPCLSPARSSWFVLSFNPYISPPSSQPTSHHLPNILPIIPPPPFIGCLPSFSLSLFPHDPIPPH